MRLSLTIPEKSFFWPDDDTEFPTGPNSVWNRSPLGSSVTLNTTGSCASSDLGDSTPTSSFDKKKRYVYLDKGDEERKGRVETLGKLITRVNERPTYTDPDGDMQRKGKRWMIFNKLWAMFTLLFWKYGFYICLTFSITD
jgi:hypothetical protein